MKELRMVNGEVVDARCRLCRTQLRAEEATLCTACREEHL